MENSLERSKINLKSKLPEIEKTLDLVRVLQQKHEAGEGLTTHYSLADTIYAKADVECSGTVCLWLGVRRVRSREGTQTAVIIGSINVRYALGLIERRCT